MKPIISIIVSIQWCPGSPNHFGIGLGKELLHPLWDDLQNFKAVTLEKDIVMGRITRETIPNKKKRLKDRNNHVISKTLQSEEGDEIIIHQSLDQALESLKGSKEIMIIGGGRLYEEALPKADRIYLTIVHGDKPADIFFPRINLEEEFSNIIEIKDLKDEQTGTPWTYMVAERT